MKFWAGVTDNEWFTSLSSRGFDEVNFWQPSAKPPFVRAPVGMPFLFKLKKPNHDIAGGGFFVAYSTLPTSLAWDVFGQKNGADSLRALQSLVGPLSGGRSLTEEIGCTVLSNPVFLPRERWLHDPAGWSGNIVRGKMYDTHLTDGAVIWSSIGHYFLESGFQRDSFGISEIRDSPMRYGEPTLVHPRLGQASFRVLVTDAYKRRCAMTGENTLIALEAAHILPYAREGQHEVNNGLLLRADFHRLFDVGLLTVTPDFKIRVSPRIREAWFNGKVYYRLNDQPMAVLPDRQADWPNRDLLNWHLQNCFQA
jgi:putative restriction endonuclease